MLDKRKYKKDYLHRKKRKHGTEGKVTLTEGLAGTDKC